MEKKKEIDSEVMMYIFIGAALMILTLAMGLLCIYNLPEFELSNLIIPVFSGTFSASLFYKALRTHQNR